MTFASAIDGSNRVVGWYQNAAGLYQGWIGLPSKNQYLTVDYPGAIETVVAGINDAGHLVGWYTDTNNATHGYFAVPK